MKNAVLVILFSLLVVKSFLYAQEYPISGEYISNTTGSNYESGTKLILAPDGNFNFEHFEKHTQAIPPERYFYGRGTWSVEKKVITLKNDSTAVNEKYNLNFTGTKARFIMKSPRDKSDRDIKTSILFYDSEIPWIPGRTLLKQNN